MGIKRFFIIDKQKIMKLPKFPLITSFYGHVQPTSSAILVMSEKFSRYLSTKIQRQTVSKTKSIASFQQFKYQESIPCYYCTKNPTNDPIDEFRAREEKKEEEFSKKDVTTETSTTKEQIENDAKINTIRAKILEASMPFVPAYGWTREAITQGAEQAGYPGVVHGIFPDGGVELIRHFYSKCNEELAEILMKETNNGEKQIQDPTDFLVRAVKIRLQMIEPYIIHWPQALAKMSLPQNVPKSLAQLLILIDDICYFSGDRSVDFGWYTRRVGLATIYKMTEIHMLQDSSTNHEATWKFLKNRMVEASHLEEFLGQIGGEQSGNAQMKFRSTFETARNILGLSYDRR